MTVYRIDHQGKKKKVVNEIDANRYQQILSAMEYLAMKERTKIVTNIETDKTVITLREEKTDLLTLEVYEQSNETRYYYTEAA